MELDYIKLKQIKPALTGYITDASNLLKPAHFPYEKTIHDVRVLMKKARSALKLVTPQLDPEFAGREKRALREVGRIMCTWRDTSVFRKTLKDLKKDRPDIFSKLEDNEQITSLMKKPEPEQVLPEDVQTVLQQIREILKKTGYRFRFEPMNNLDAQLLLKELEVTYNCVAYNYLVCRNNPKQPKLHELRKRSKDFLYQLWFFRPLNPSVVKALENKLDVMTQNLGKYNDLARLINTIDYKFDISANNPALDELIVIIREKQDKYLSKVWPVTYKIFCPGQKLVNVLGFRLLVI